MHTETDSEFVDETEAAAALDPDVGEGTPDTAPTRAVFVDDDDLEPGEDGTPDDDDDADD